MFVDVDIHVKKPSSTAFYFCLKICHWVINHDLTVELYQTNKKGIILLKKQLKSENNYQKSMEKYASEYVCKEEIEDFLRNVNYRVVRERIKTEKL